MLAEVCDAGTSVLLLGEANDIALYRELIRRGISDYLVKPIAPRQIFDAVAAICIDPSAPPMGRLLAFVGSRGGAGSSTIAHNVTWQLAKTFQEEVVLIDLDVSFGTAGLAFNLESPQGVHTALSDPDRLDEVLLERFLIEYDDNIRLMMAPASLEAEDKIYMDALEKLLDLVRRRASYVVLDLPHRWSPWTQQALLDADESAIVTTLDLASLRDTKNIVDRLKQQRGENALLHIVLNHYGAFKKTELSPKDFETAIELKAAAVIPHDPSLFGTASNNGQLLGEVNARHKAVEAIAQLALAMSGRQPPKQKKGFFDTLLKAKPKIKMKAKPKAEAKSEAE